MVSLSLFNENARAPSAIDVSKEKYPHLELRTLTLLLRYVGPATSLRKIPAVAKGANMSNGGSERRKDRRPGLFTRFPTAFLRLYAQKILRISKKASNAEA